MLPKHGKGFLFHRPFFPLKDSLSCPFCEAEDSDRPYSPREPEEETNEIERQRSRAQDAMAQSWPRAQPPSAGSTGTEDSEKNEVISTQQMCKAFPWLASAQQI